MKLYQTLILINMFYYLLARTKNMPPHELKVDHNDHIEHIRFEDSSIVTIDKSGSTIVGLPYSSFRRIDITNTKNKAGGGNIFKLAMYEKNDKIETLTVNDITEDLLKFLAQYDPLLDKLNIFGFRTEHHAQDAKLIHTQRLKASLDGNLLLSTITFGNNGIYFYPDAFCPAKVADIATTQEKSAGGQQDHCDSYLYSDIDLIKYDADDSVFHLTKKSDSGIGFTRKEHTLHIQEDIEKDLLSTIALYEGDY
jgi:hypothetical protein